MRILINKNWKKYVFVFFATCAVFTTGWYLSAFINNKKINDLQDLQNKIATDILSSETQFYLLQELSCADVERSPFSEELSIIAEKISFVEENLRNMDEIISLKKQYSILEVKDFLLNKRIAEKCNKKFESILYFYTTAENCPSCIRQASTLDALRFVDKNVYIYAFDYNLDLSIINALKTTYKIKEDLPALVINGTTFNGYQDLEKIKKELL